LKKLCFKLSILIKPIAIKVFKHLQKISTKNRIFNVPLNIIFFLIIIIRFWNLQNRIPTDFYIPGLSNDMKLAVQKNHLGGQIFLHKFGPFEKNGVYFRNIEKQRKISISSKHTFITNILRNLYKSNKPRVNWKDHFLN